MRGTVNQADVAKTVHLERDCEAVILRNKKGNQNVKWLLKLTRLLLL